MRVDPAVWAAYGALEAALVDMSRDMDKRGVSSSCEPRIWELTERLWNELGADSGQLTWSSPAMAKHWRGSGTPDTPGEEPGDASRERRLILPE